MKNGVSNQWYLITLTTRDFNKGVKDFFFPKKSRQNEHWGTKFNGLTSDPNNAK